MQDFTIKGFWTPRLSVADDRSSRSSKERPGWEYVDDGLETFLEAPLKHASGYGGEDGLDPEKSNVILVSAPGAVGKSTLARQIAFKAKAVLFDLAKAGCVGDNTISGGLFKMKLAQKFQQGYVSLVIDGLDEARMKVSQDSFKDFIQDIVDLINDSEQNCKPIALFGRTSAVDETWFWLSEFGITAPVLEIGYYDKNQAAKFAKIQVKSIRGERNEREPDGRAIELILSRLRDNLSKDQDNFSGYAPVLNAVAKQVADPEDMDTDSENTARLISDIENGRREITLPSIAQAILTREQKKLDSLSFKDKNLCKRLYTPEEQIDRLIARVYGGQDADIATKYLPNDLSEDDKVTYFNALENNNWLTEHPFLDGMGVNPSSEVFEGLLASKALTMESFANEALQREFNRDIKANPFLAEFYISRLEEQDLDLHLIKSSHVGILYASLRSRLLQGGIASLLVDVDEDKGKLSVEIEISINGNQNNERHFAFLTECDGHFQFGSQIENVRIDAPKAKVTVGYGRNQEAVFIAPIFIEIEKFNLKPDSIAIMKSSQSQNEPADINLVSLEARELGSQQTYRPKLRGNAKLETRGPMSNPFFVNMLPAPPVTSRSCVPKSTGLEKVNVTVNGSVVKMSAGTPLMLTSGGMPSMILNSSRLSTPTAPPPRLTPLLASNAPSPMSTVSPPGSALVS
ncbi:MAG: hypothetical protein OXC96_06750 [Cyanobacteria bacterium MAG CAR1_bin_15]|nr:hypothetical protein [Cyanobacteria bacterium MAG CAR1_bin_15]